MRSPKLVLLPDRRDAVEGRLGLLDAHNCTFDDGRGIAMSSMAMLSRGFLIVHLSSKSSWLSTCMMAGRMSQEVLRKCRSRTHIGFPEVQ